MGPEDLLPGDWIAGPMVVMGAPDEMGVETDIPQDLADEIIAMEHLLLPPATGTGPGTCAMTPEEVRDLFDKAQELEELGRLVRRARRGLRRS